MRRVAVLSFLLALPALPALALQLGDQVGNFALLDHAGAAHSLHYLSDQRAVALMSHLNGCAEHDDAVRRFNAAGSAYRSRGVEFLMIGAANAADRAAVAQEMARLGGEVPVLLDEAGIIGSALGFERAGEVLIVKTDGWELAWRGGTAGMSQALDAVLAGETPSRQPEGAAGCELETPLSASPAASISYARDIAPILLNNCVACHRQNGIGPWQMTSYDMVRGFAPMIREVIRTRRMPPWHADPAHGDFVNDRSLSAQEVQTLVQWVEAGAPRGDGPDPLMQQPQDWPEWGLGEPDLVLDIPPYDVPASGVVDYQYQTVENPLDRDVWVRATEILPGDRQALHHVITRFHVPEARKPSARGFGRRGGGLGGYVPGAVAREYPEGTGTLLPAGARLVFQMHYTPYGKAATDRSRFGLYFHDEQPRHSLGSMVLLNTDIRIPPHAKAHSESQSQVLKRDALVYSLLPHAHYRGKASNFVAHYPDGAEEMLLSVPAYDFNWQTSYVLREPKALPAGTRIVHTTTWDNSAQNPANPDPSREVPWGRQSWDEMLFGAIAYRHLSDEEARDLARAEPLARGAAAGD